MLADSSGRTRQRSGCPPRSDICFIPAAIPPRIFSASNPGGNAGSEKSTVSGSWPTNNTRFMIESPLITISRWHAHHVPPSAIYLGPQSSWPSDGNGFYTPFGACAVLTDPSDLLPGLCDDHSVCTNARGFSL